MRTPPARRLAAALEPVVGCVYFSPETHDAFEALGYGPSTGRFAGVAGPEPRAYFCSRAASMGQVPGEVVAAAFGVFNPAVVVPLVTEGWTIADAPTLARTRVEGVTATLGRVLGEPGAEVLRATELLLRAAEPLAVPGRPLYAGLRALGPLDQPWSRLHWAGDLLREFRGDSHTMSWGSAGLSGPEIGLLTESYWGLPLRSYARTRSWSEVEFDAAHDRLRSLGWLDDEGLTELGRAEREAIEDLTDRQCEPAVAALGDDLEELLGILSPWGAALREAHCYPGAGPVDLASAARARR